MKVYVVTGLDGYYVGVYGSLEQAKAVRNSLEDGGILQEEEIDSPYLDRCRIIVPNG